MARGILAGLLVMLLAAGAGVAGEKPWFDMENCAMCKPMMSNPELMQNISWESHEISKGILMVTTVNGKFLDQYRTAHMAMAETAKKLQKGETMEMCGSCTVLGKCFMQGAVQEYVETSTGDVWFATSDNPEVVAELHSWAKKNKEEMTKMAQKKKG